MNIDFKKTLIALVTFAMISASEHGMFTTDIALPGQAYVVSITQIIVSLALILFANKLMRILENKAFLFGVALVFALGVALFQAFPQTGAVRIIASVLTSSGETIMFIYAGVFLVSFNTNERRVAAFGGMGLSCFITVILFNLPAILSIATQVVFIGFLAWGIWYLYLRDTAHAQIERQEINRQAHMPWIYLLIVLVFAFGMRFLRVGTSGSVDWPVVFASAAILSVVLILMDFAFTAQARMSPLNFIIAVLLAVPILVFGAGFPIDSLLLAAATTGFILLIPSYHQWMLGFIDDEKINPFSAFAVMTLALTVGQMLGGAGVVLSFGADAPLLRYGIAIVIAVSILFCAYVPLSKQSKDRMVRFLDFDNGSEKDGEKPRTNEALEDELEDSLLLGALEGSCSKIAEAYSLTRREKDVLLYLARRRVIRSIALDMHLSVNTVKSHILHIHQKLDVHSREELFDLIEKYSD